MKFGEHLRTNLTPEWNSQYIPYEDMKDFLTEVVTKLPSIIKTNQHLTREQYFALADEKFFQYCEMEASKINTFFIEKLAEALLRLDLLKTELECIKNIHRHDHLAFNNPSYTSRIITNVNENDENSADSWINNFTLRRSNSIIQRRRMKRHQFRKVNDLKLAFSEFYLMLIMLKNYQTLNFTGFCKILKKHDKLFETTRGYEWQILSINSLPFHTSTQVDQLIHEVETLYTNKLEYGDRTRAMQRLRIPPLEEKQPRIVTFRLGMLVGMICLLIPMLIILGIALFGSHSLRSLNWHAALHLYRSSFFIILHIIFFGINVYGWSTSGVNHVLIFEIDPRNHLTYQRFLELGALLMVIWLLSFNSFLLSFYFDTYPFVQPFAFVIFIILFLINPIPIFYYKARLWFIKRLGRVCLAPFFRVEFADFWLGDQFCSLELAFFDVEFFICFYINQSNWSSSDPTHQFFCNGWSQLLLQGFLLILPSWFRFAQCLRRYRDTKQKFPHLVNAGKYASTFFVAVSNVLRRANSFDYNHNRLENPFLYVWIITSLISSTYKVIWDLKMDWGFFATHAGENKYLREQIVYPMKRYYYAAIIQNILFRYIWIINIFIPFASLFAEYADIFGFGFGLIEIFRRFIWNYFRLENEHLNNCGEFRAVRDISIQPTPTTDGYFALEETIEQETDNQTRTEDRATTNRMNNTLTLDPNVCLSLD